MPTSTDFPTCVQACWTQVEAFFVQYNHLSCKDFRVRGRGDADAAFALVRKGNAAHLEPQAD